MPNPVEGLLEVYEDMAEALPVLRYFSQRILRLTVCSVVLLPALKPPCSSLMIFSVCGFALFSMIFQHNFAWMADGDEADDSIVLAPLQDAFLGKCDDQGLGLQGWPFSCLPDLLAHCCESSDNCFSTCFGQFCWGVVNTS